MKSGKQLGLLAVGIIVAFVAVFLLLRERSDTRSSAPPALDAKAEDLRLTQITAVMDAPIQSGTNLLWCGTFQLAWNEVADFFGEDLSFVEDVPLAAVLNRKEFTKDALDEASYVAVGGLPTRDTFDRIQAELRRKFGRSFNTELSPPTNTPVAAFFYACLLKNLAFEKRFHRSERPLRFGTNDVAAFGIELGGPAEWRLRRQVRVRDYRNTNDFIIELKTKSEADLLLLAKVPPQPTLAETVKTTLRRLEAQSRTDVDFLNLWIPKTDFKLDRNYDELLEKHLALKKSTQWNDLRIILARQIIQFRLDERGASLKSEAAMAVDSTAAHGDVDLIFDRPFLVLLQRVGASVPYFTLWVDNAELLVRWNSESNSPGTSRGR